MMLTLKHFDSKSSFYTLQEIEIKKWKIGHLISSISFFNSKEAFYSFHRCRISYLFSFFFFERFFTFCKVFKDFWLVDYRRHHHHCYFRGNPHHRTLTFPGASVRQEMPAVSIFAFFANMKYLIINRNK